ncbi:MAG: PAS domain S-box protein [Geobacter sp.]|nr:MAG: PAS domain S-box protein [Geobacter sp.]
MVNITITQLVTAEQTQRLVETCHRMTGLFVAILDDKGITVAAAGSRDSCCPFHHQGSDCCEYFREGNSSTARLLPDPEEDYLEFTCTRGLRHISAPLVVDGTSVATLLTGRFFYDHDKPDQEQFRAWAQAFNHDEESYQDAFCQIPVFSKKRIIDILDSYQEMVQVPLEIGLKNLELVQKAQKREQHDKTLRHSEDMLKKICETIPDQLHIIDRNFRIQHSNWQGSFFSTPEEERTQNPLCYKVYYELDRPCDHCHTSEVFKTGKPVIREKFIPKLGHVEIRSFPIFDPSGTVTLVLEHIHDISERRLAEEALRESGQKLSNTIQSLPLPMFVVNKDQEILFWNKALEQLSGVKAAEVIGTNRAWSAFYEAERPVLAGLLAGGDSGQVSHWYGENIWQSKLAEEALEVTEFFPGRHEQGKWLHLTATVLRDTRGNVAGALETLEDVTERKLADEKWQSLFNNLPGGSFTVNNNYIIEDVNDVLCAVTGYSREELVGQLCGIICPKGPHLCPIFDLGKDRIDNDETAVKARDGRLVPIIKSARRIPVGNRGIIVENFQDITDRKQLEEQLRHAQKMEAIGQLAGGVAHDFNNILTAIIGYGNLLQIKLGKTAAMGNYVDQIIYAAERAANLTSNLLAFSRKQPVKLQAVMVNDIVGKSRELLSRLVREDIKLQVITGSSCAVQADSVQIEQIMMNLVTNARDAMPDGGRLTITTERIILDKEFIRMRGHGEPGPYALISVSDTGLGMEGKIRERIFEPFFTTKKTGKGTGLGLAIVYGIIKQHNGYIDVSSKPGKGTRFRIYLPVLQENTIQKESAEMTAPPVGSETILLAEDDQAVRNLAKSVLEEFGYRVIEAENGAVAIEKFLSHIRSIQLLLFDVMMPEKNGKEAYNEILKVQPEMKVLFMSGYTDDILSNSGIHEANLNLIAKPFTHTILLKKVREILDKGVGLAGVQPNPLQAADPQGVVTKETDAFMFFPA